MGSWRNLIVSFICWSEYMHKGWFLCEHNLERFQGSESMGSFDKHGMQAGENANGFGCVEKECFVAENMLYQSVLLYIHKYLVCAEGKTDLNSIKLCYKIAIALGNMITFIHVTVYF